MPPKKPKAPFSKFVIRHFPSLPSMRIVLITIAVALILLGMWGVAKSFVEPPPVPGQPGTIQSAQQPEGSPIGLGVGLVAGGVVLLVVAVRRR
jgi:hypothetical protein